MACITTIQRDASRIPVHTGHRIPWVAVEQIRNLWLRRALRNGHGREDAEDIFQDALLAALEGLERLRVADGQEWKDAFLAWLWGIIRHKSVSHQRRRKRLQQILEGQTVKRQLHAGGGIEATQVRTSLGLLERSSPGAARVLRLRFLEGRQLSELAVELGVSVPTACRRVQVALAGLRECVELVCL
ncbi:MAG: sigma-70 family RNA polymerase sigma factor [Candidatus Eisenbacteria sp.]|nr:sigma-70 family RNA polymerase sigma factor [Candidatus Eisenbacteria bacterium]